MEVRRQIDREDRVPLLARKVIDRCDILDAGVVDEHVHRAETLDRAPEHALDFLRLAHIGAVIDHRHIVLRLQPALQILDFLRITETVDDQVRALRAKPFRYAQADAAGRTGDQRCLALECHIRPSKSYPPQREQPRNAPQGIKDRAEQRNTVDAPLGEARRYLP